MTTTDYTVCTPCFNNCGNDLVSIEIQKHVQDPICIRNAQFIDAEILQLNLIVLYFIFLFVKCNYFFMNKLGYRM